MVAEAPWRSTGLFYKCVNILTSFHVVWLSVYRYFGLGNIRQRAQFSDVSAAILLWFDSVDRTTKTVTLQVDYFDISACDISYVCYGDDLQYSTCLRDSLGLFRRYSGVYSSKYYEVFIFAQ